MRAAYRPRPSTVAGIAWTVGSLQIFGEAPDALTFVFGQQPFLVVRGREKCRAA